MAGWFRATKRAVNNRRAFPRLARRVAVLDSFDAAGGIQRCDAATRFAHSSRGSVQIHEMEDIPKTLALPEPDDLW